MVSPHLSCTLHRARENSWLPSLPVSGDFLLLCDCVNQQHQHVFEPNPNALADERDTHFLESTVAVTSVTPGSEALHQGKDT